jgi:hypothetical protein
MAKINDDVRPFLIGHGYRPGRQVRGPPLVAGKALSENGWNLGGLDPAWIPLGSHCDPISEPRRLPTTITTVIP